MSFPYPAVLFDLDGTLVDSASDIAEAVNRLFDDLGVPRVPEATVRGWIGDGARQLLATALAHAGSDTPVDAAMDRFMVHYEACLLRDARLYPGVAETLAALRARSARLGVCTNKPERFVRPLLAALGVSDAIEACVGGDSLPERKPSPLPLLHLAARLGHRPGECLMVGDSRTDFLAAQAAGMPVVLVAYGYPRDFDLRRAGALAVLERFDALLELGAAPVAAGTGAGAGR
ncbi:phosphoglycolate phosphatase [Luteimonas huabeiensis]|uniref:phosphoglycolate phosphatase n=1 Tax=Luteimonas huabeiensis TaxID=1244513 RepID=UPI000464ADEF|nr:phosphoglycolate phosphatase [Luteimonas huabeiensis]